MKRKNNGIFYVVISLVAVLVIAGGVKANISLSQLIANAIADRVAPEVVNSLDLDLEEPVLGGFGVGIYDDATFYGEIQLERAKANIVIPITLHATTSAAGKTNDGVAGTFKNIGDPMVCTNPSVYLWDAVDKFGWSFGVGTTTNKDGHYLTATTSRTIFSDQRIATSSEKFGWSLYGLTNTSTGADFIYQTSGTFYNDGANASGTPWLLDTNDVIVIDFTAHGATTSDSFTESGVDLTPGAFYLDCIDVVDDRD